MFDMNILGIDQFYSPNKSNNLRQQSKDSVAIPGFKANQKIIKGAAGAIGATALAAQQIAAQNIAKKEEETLFTERDINFSVTPAGFGDVEGNSEPLDD